MIAPSSTKFDTPVLIAGGGATGLMQALLLARQGVASCVLEARTEPYDSPRAHAINPRSLEICRALGLDIARMQRQAAPAEDGGRVYFVPRLFGPVFGSLPYERQDAGALAFTPTPLINLPQTEFEQILREAVLAEPLIRVEHGWRWAALSEKGESLISTIETPDGERRLASRYLIGCDGAGSSVREALGIGMSGDAAVLACLSIVFRADLRAALADRRGMLFWATDPAASGTFLGYHMDRLWSFVEMHPPGRIDLSLYPEERCRAIVTAAAGGDIRDLEIVGITPWTMTSQVADSYGRDRVWLAGNSAHRFPPTGGLGLNTGIQDAHNLAWRIAAVEKGWAAETLLSDYETERRPVALSNAKQSLVNAQRLAALAELRCEEEVWRDPVTFQAWLDEGDRRSRIAAAIALQVEHFDSFGLQLGFRYPPAPASDEPVAVYRPTAVPGCRLPHGWLGPGGRSILDLLDPTRFTLLTQTSDDREDERVTLIDLSGQPIPDDWFDIVALAPGEAILVRPDGFVAWRGGLAGAGAGVDAALGVAPVRAVEVTA